MGCCTYAIGTQGIFTNKYIILLLNPALTNDNYGGNFNFSTSYYIKVTNNCFYQKYAIFYWIEHTSTK